MTPLTVEEFITHLAGAPITLSEGPPKDEPQAGQIIVWPSRLADSEETPGRHIEAVVCPTGNAVLVMVSPRVYEALGGVWS